MDQARITPDTYLRVTLRSQKAFKGFLLRAEAGNDRHVGTWYIPYLADTSYLSESQYLHCNNHLQSAVTHSGKTSAMWVVSFQWRPPHQFYGWVTFRATVVEDYRTFWTNITSTPILVMPSDAENNIIDYKNDDSIYDNIDDEHDDYYDMTVGESRTVTSSNDDISPGFTLLPISIPGDYQDQPDLEHESSPRIDYDSEYHETEPVQQVPNVYSNQETTLSTRRRPSILMTPPLRPRTVSASRPTTKALPSTTTTTATTTTITSTTSRTISSSTSTTSTTTKSKSSSLRSSEESIVTVTDVPGGIMVFARKTTPQNVRRRITPKHPKIMHPKFVFTTETTTLKTSTEAILTTSSMLDDDSTTEMSSSTTTTTTSTTTTSSTTTRTSSTELTTTVTEDKDNPIYFHHFDLTEDEQTAIVDSDLDIVNEIGEQVPDKNKTMYSVEPYFSTTVPTFEDLEVINVTKTNNQRDIPKLRSDLYDVIVNENATEVITIGQVTELERRPRDNDQVEPLESAYKRLEAQYGGWENGSFGVKIGGHCGYA